jgi:hypothetical protein
MTHFIGPEHKETDLVSDERGITHDCGPDCDSPVSQLIPGEKVSRITQGKSEDEEKDSNHPVEFTRWPVGTCVENPDHVQEDRYYHPMRSPSMEVSQDLSIEDQGQSLHIEICPFDGGCVEEHQKDTRDGENDEEEAGDSAEAEGIGEPKAMALHLRGKDMEEEVMKHHHGSLQIRIRYSGSEDGSPDCRL